jgi:hypothetical protein
MTRPFIGSLLRVSVHHSGIGIGHHIEIAQVTSLPAAMAVERLFGAALYWTTEKRVTEPEAAYYSSHPLVGVFPQAGARA